MDTRRALGSVIVSAGVAAIVQRIPEPPVPGWRRRNYRDRPVSLSGGLAACAGAVAGMIAAGGPWRQPALLAAGSALLAGGYDDLAGPRAEKGADKGLQGHLRALRSGRISGGVVKVAVIGGGALLAARRLPTAGIERRGAASSLLSAAIIAGSANLVNLFDLRPGRAAKLTLACGAWSAVIGTLAGPVAAASGAAAAVLPGDLGEVMMLGDLGANTLGALIGVRVAAGPSGARIAAAAVIGGLTLVSERVSFSQVIESVPALRWLDQLGRSAVEPAAR